MNHSSRRLLAYGSNATLVTVLVLGVLVALYWMASIYRVKMDFTEGASNTLQEEMIGKVELLDAEGIPVQITAFSAQRGKDDAYFKNRAIKDLLRALGEASNGTVTWQFVDFDRERLTAEKLGVNDYGRVVIQRGEDRVDIRNRELFQRIGKGVDRHIAFVGEAAIGRALAQLLTPQRRVVYVLSGHGDLDPQERGPDGLSLLVEALDQERYDVETLDLLRSTREGELPTVPDDAAMVFLARPQTKLTPQEEDTLLAWVGRGGSVLVAVDVDSPVPSLLDRMGVAIPEGVALQSPLQVPYRDRPIPIQKNHPINTTLREDKLLVVLAHPAPVAMADPTPDGVQLMPVLSSTRDGWIDRGGDLVGGAAVYEPEIDQLGPVDMVVALRLLPGGGLVRETKSAARIVVAGDADMFTNALLGEAPGNTMFAVNTVHWLAGSDRRLGVVTGVGAAQKVRRLALTQQELGTLRFITLGFLPLLIGFMGLGMWWIRRGR